MLFSVVSDWPFMAGRVSHKPRFSSLWGRGGTVSPFMRSLTVPLRYETLIVHTRSGFPHFRPSAPPSTSPPTSIPRQSSERKMLMRRRVIRLCRSPRCGYPLWQPCGVQGEYSAPFSRRIYPREALHFAYRPAYNTSRASSGGGLAERLRRAPSPCHRWQ